MLRSWAVALAVVSLAGASSALAANAAPSPAKPGQTAPGKNAQQGQPSQGAGASANKSYEATKHVAVINAGLRDASVNSQMLADISSDSRSYDRAHGETFVKNIQDAVTQAEGHLAHLQPLATTSNEKAQLQQLSQRLTSAKGMLQPMANQLDNPKQIHDSAMKLNKEFMDGMTPLKQFAQEANVKIKVG